MKTQPHFILTITLICAFFGSLNGQDAQDDVLRFSKFPKSFGYYSPFQRDQPILLNFNQPVAVERAAKHFQFTAKDLPSVGVNASRPSIKQIKSFGYSLIGSDASERQINCFVLLKPTSDLDFATWNLSYTKGLASMHGIYRLKQGGNLKLDTINPFKFESVKPNNPYNGQNSITFKINKARLDKKHHDNDETIKLFKVSPDVENLSLTQSRYQLTLFGDFEPNKYYTISIASGLLANDGVLRDTEYVKRVKVEPRVGYVSLPTYSSAQNATGNRKFSVETANVESLKIRVKKLKADNILFAIRGYNEGYKGDGKNRTIPFSLIPGKTIHESEHDTKAPIDTTKITDLDWQTIDKGSKHGAYYISANGESHTRPGKSLGAHSIVQLTDIGLAWKKSRNNTLLYVYSIATGAPKTGVKIRLLEEEGELVHTAVSDSSGLVRVDAPLYQDKDLWLDASIGNDRHLLSFTQDLDEIYPYLYGVPYKRNDKEVELDRRTLLFSDRDVYKPGETVYLKCISRLADNDSLLAPSAAKAQFRVMDFRGRRLINKEVELSPVGTWDDQFTLPEEGLGRFTVELDFNTDEGRNWGLITRHTITTAEFRANTFELSLTTPESIDSEQIKIPLSAQYYMGKPLNKAKLSWTAHHRNTFPIASGLNGFSFGDRYSSSMGEAAEGKADLSEVGESTIEFDVVLDQEVPAPRSVSVFAQVTDINQQTISKRSKFMVHSSDFYIGVKAPKDILLAGNDVTFQFANIDTNGDIYEKVVDTSILIEKITYNQIKIKGSDGNIRIKNEKQIDLVGSQQAALQSRADPESGLPLTATHSINFAEAGEYMITFESMDEKNRRALTRIKVWIAGLDAASWAWNRVQRVDMYANQSEYKIGDTAKVLLRTPVFGKALITTERSGIRSTEIREITKHETVLEFPIKSGDAPNIFVSAYLVRGSADSPHRHPSAEYRIGFCQLNVQDPKDSLDISIDVTEREFHLPGSEITGGISVKDANGRPVANAEVVLYAVDEGVLSLTNYENPNPSAVFHRPFPLSVVLGQSISELLPENPQQRTYTNKGFVIGGGLSVPDASVTGDLNRIRKDFKTVALWVPDLTTDENGLASFKFTAPDNLTTYRLIAVAASGNKFANDVAPLTINKPVMISPSLPAFSNLGDQIDLAAVIHNNTPETHEMLIEVNLDEHSTFIKKLGQTIPTLFTNKLKVDRTVKETVTIKPGESHALRWPVALAKLGEATWMWKATSKTNPKIVDQTVTKLQVNYPLPLLKSRKSFVINEANQSQDLLASFDSKLLQNTGELSISISNSRLHEGRDGLDYLLRYPYGCVEQTSSSTIPWISSKTLKSVLPDLEKTDADIKSAIAKGVNRLLTMQTYDGGLSYWPGGNESMLWGSAYGGLTLALAEKSGHKISEDRLNHLWEYLSSQLRDMSDSTLSECCLASYALAVAGESEPAYLNKLYENREQLDRGAKAILAMAISQTEVTDKTRVQSLLNEVANTALETKSYRYNQGFQVATELIARTNIEGDSTVTIGRLFDNQKGQFGWGNTYSNAWALMAIAQYVEQNPLNSTSLVAELKTGEQAKMFTFENKVDSKQVDFRFDFKRNQPLLPLSITSNDSKQPIYVTAELAARPKLLPAEPVNKGFGITRQYFKIESDGQTEPLSKVSVGDLVKVQLEVDLPIERYNYLAIDDPLPANLEAINSQFTTQQVAVNGKPKHESDGKKISYLRTNRRELRSDRALFFTNWAPKPGKYQIVYLARVISAGECIAPPTKIEAMYAPDVYGLSSTQMVSSRSLQFKKKGKKLSFFNKQK